MTQLDSKKWEKIIVIEERSFIGSATGRANGTVSQLQTETDKEKKGHSAKLSYNIS